MVIVQSWVVAHPDLNETDALITDVNIRSHLFLPDRSFVLGPVFLAVPPFPPSKKCRGSPPTRGNDTKHHRVEGSDVGVVLGVGVRDPHSHPSSFRQVIMPSSCKASVGSSRRPLPGTLFSKFGSTSHPIPSGPSSRGF